MTSMLSKLNKQIIQCNKCKRLVAFREKIATEKRKQFINETYWGKPITGYGDINAKFIQNSFTYIYRRLMFHVVLLPGGELFMIRFDNVDSLQMIHGHAMVNSCPLSCWLSEPVDCRDTLY